MKLPKSLQRQWEVVEVYTPDNAVLLHVGSYFTRRGAERSRRYWEQELLSPQMYEGSFQIEVRKRK